MNELFSALLLSLLYTLILEIIFFCFIGYRHRKDLLLLILINVVTNPMVVISYWLIALYTDWHLQYAQIVLEIWAILTEGYFFRKYGCEFKRPFFFALMVNLFSYGVGFVLQNVL